MLKGKFKYIVLVVGVLIVSLGIMKSTSFAFGNYNKTENFSEPRTYNEGFMMRSKGHHRNFRLHRGCMGNYFYDDYELNK